MRVFPVTRPCHLAQALFHELRRSHTLLFQEIAAIALTASCYPGVATNNLLFAAPLFVCVLFIVAAQPLKPTTYRLTFLSLTAISLAGILWTITGQPQTVSIDTQLGTVRVNLRDVRNIEFSASVVDSGDSLICLSVSADLVFTQRGNQSDALRVFAAGEWVIWPNLPPRTVLAMWPH